MKKKQFKAESKRLLELMINSIYTNKEIFLRELISNASDALDKRYYLSLTDPACSVEKEDLKIRIERHPENRTLVIEDTGVGMTDSEMETNLGTIAKSGSAEFRAKLEEGADNIDIIGQFGVGFYSAFMVSDRITVESKSVNSDTAYLWTSSGEDGYTIEPAERTEPGTRITLWLKADNEDENYSDYLDEQKIRDLVKKYSDYVRYPITMDVTKEIPDPTDKDSSIITTETETLNSMIPLWKKSKNELTQEDYNEFYKSKFNDWQDPAKVIHYSVEGNLSYTALLFIPSKAPYDFYTSEYKSGLQLYSKGVFILDKAKDLLPECYRFVAGLVDSDDLNLNISREILQQDRQVKALASSIEKKIQKALEDMLKKERETYEKMFDSFGLNMKYDIYRSFGANAEKLQDLLLYHSSRDGDYVTLAEYKERMPEDQKSIYFASGSSVDEIEKLPALEKVRDKGYEILYFTDAVDEFVISMMQNYKDIPFRSVSKGDLDLDSEEEKKEREEKAEANKDMLAAMKDALDGKVREVRISSRLKDDPVVLVSDEGMSIEMEKVLSQNPENRGMMKAVKILEINPDHPVFAVLQKAHENDAEKLAEYASVLYDQACLIEGLPIEDPVSYARKITDLLVKSA